MEIAFGDDPVALDKRVGLDIRRRTQTVVKGSEILVAVVQKLLKTVDHEIGLLEIVDDVFRAHDPFEIEADSVGGRIFERKNRLGRR
jgi:hypothetical protein